MTAMSDPNRCGLYQPGHMVHFIQARKSWETPDQFPRLPGTLVDVSPEDAGWLVIELATTETVRLWNHETERLRAYAHSNAGALWYQARWGLVGVPHGGGDYLFCVAEAGAEIAPCPDRRQDRAWVRVARRRGERGCSHGTAQP